MYNSLVFSVFTDMCDHHHSQPEDIFITSERDPVSFSYNPSWLPFPPSWALHSH